MNLNDAPTVSKATGNNLVRNDMSRGGGGRGNGLEVEPHFGGGGGAGGGGGKNVPMNEIYFHTVSIGQLEEEVKSKLKRFSTFTKSPADAAAQVAAAAEEDKSGPCAQFVYKPSHDAPYYFDLNKDYMKIGRKQTNDIRLNCIQISKEHAAIERTPTGYYISDLNSSNGITVNNQKVKGRRLLKDKDVVQLGTFTLTFEDRRKRMSAPVGAGAPVATQSEELRDLVRILPSEATKDAPVEIRKTESGLLSPGQNGAGKDFLPADQIKNMDNLKQDYEQLRMAYELSQIRLCGDMSVLLKATLQHIFTTFPFLDCGVVMLVDKETGFLSTNTVHIRENRQGAVLNILMSSTILNQVLNQKMCMITADAFQDPRFSGSNSILKEMIRSAICVPLIASDNNVLGVLHLDSRQKIGAFKDKDLALIKAIANQTAIAIENTMLLKRIEKEAHTISRLSRFLPPHLVTKMASSTEMIKKGGRLQTGTVIFADIRDFTRYSESSSPEEVVELLNNFFEVLVDIVFERNGVLDKYIGDCLMAVFGTLDGEKDPVYNAVAAAIGFRDAIREMNKDRREQNLPEIGIGVGVNTGELVAGFIGSSKRLEYTSIGDTVNTSSRICSIANADQVLISETTYQAIKNRVQCKFVSKCLFKGKQQEVEVYEAIRLLA